MYNEMFIYLKGEKGKADKFASFNAMNVYRRSRSIVSLIHIFGTRWM